MSLPDDPPWKVQKPHIDLYLAHQKKHLGDDCLFQSLFTQLKSCYPDHRAIYTDLFIFIYLFGVLRCFQHCTGHITTGSWKGRGNQYIQFVRVLYCKLPTNGKQLPAFPLEAVLGIEPRPQRYEARVLPLCHRSPYIYIYIYTDGSKAEIGLLQLLHLITSVLKSDFQAMLVYSQLNYRL